MSRPSLSVVEEQSAEERLIAHLRGTGRLDADNAERAARVLEHGQSSLTKILLELGLVPERELVAAFTAALGIPPAMPDDFPVEPILTDAISERFLRDARAVPLSATEDTLTVALADPLDTYVRDALRLATGLRVQVKAAVTADIEEALRRLYPGADAAQAGGAGENVEEVTESDLARLRESASEAPVIRFVNTLISRAVEAGASDIHIEPLERRLRIRTRIDGVLKEEEPASIDLAPAVLSRLKIMSGLNIAERRLPQDGAVKLAVRGKEIDLRIATAPVTHGEAAAVRILDKSAVTLDFDALGFDATMQAKLNALLDRPNGIVLVTGPTGSGKTTTLYAALQRLNTPTRKILSVEDPVEYKIAGVNQVQVKPDIGLTFAHVLRSFLRHDPDVILVGEIRDPETARIAVQASLTGHLVLSTVHTNSAAAAITRLIDMHVEDYLLSSTVIGILAQRLVRVLCRSCKTPIDIAPEWQREADALGIREPKLFAAKGCPACHGTGYRGRTVIAELLTPDDAVRRMIVDRAAAAHIHAGAVSHGMESLRRNGLRRALEGLTSLEEISRVAYEEE
ncbi:MAG: GspE/PulE family protein [Alphaproteobacteria bacterium]|nr:GspE/PulE family protein [Alphaproteobacteria bacterium]